MNKILVLNGPNLNLLGEREPDLYGNHSLEDIQKFTEDHLKKFGFDKVKLDWYQSNSESELIEKIQREKENFDAYVINPAAYTHTSVAILDALKPARNRWLKFIYLTRMRERTSEKK